MIDSTCCSSCSVNFSPAPENTLMPLSSNGLCDAEITTPALYPMRGVKYAIAGVGMMPAPVNDASSLLMPNASSRSIHAPDSRVSRPDKKRGRPSPLARAESRASARASAAPSRRTVGGSRGYVPALPRTPSVPNRRLIECGPSLLLAPAARRRHGRGPRR